MNSVLMRSMNDSYIKIPFSLPCLPRVPSEYLAGFSFSVSLSLLSVLPPRILCSSFPSVFFVLFFLSLFAFRLFFPLPLQCGGGGARAPSPFPFPSLSSPVGASLRFGSALAGLPSGPSGFPGAALLRLRRAPFAVPSRFLPLSARHGPLRRVILFRIFQCFALYAPSAPRSGPRPMPAARPVWGPYGKAPRFPPALRFVCFCENFPLPAQKSPRFFWPSAFFVLPLHPLSPSSGPCARGGVVL